MKRTASNRFRYSFQKILTGSDLAHRRLPVMQVSGEATGPTVWLTACAHGDEVGGIAIIQEVFKAMRTVRLLRGEIHAFPLMNPIGFEMGSRNIPMVKEDLNRSFPGSPNGSLAERIAHVIITGIDTVGADLVIDLHNDWIQSIPYALLDPVGTAAQGRKPYRLASRAALVSGLPVLCEQSGTAESEGWETTLSGALMRKGVPALTLEMGEAYVVNEDHVATGVRAILNLLADRKMIDPPDPPFSFPLPEPFHNKLLRYSHQPVTTSSGIIRFRVRPGQIVRPGQPVARIYNAFGKLQETLRAEAEALVLGHSDSSVAFPGKPVVAFGLS